MGRKTALDDHHSWAIPASVLPRLQRLALLYGGLFLVTNFVLTWLTPGLAYGARGVVGADFLAFYTAGEMTLQGRALDAYDFEAFDAALQTRLANEHLGMMWQYPPLMFFLAGLLALMPYKISLWIWISGTAALFAWALNRLIAAAAPELSARWMIVALVLASPLCMIVVTSGQISLFTGAMLMTAIYRPKVRWLMAGLAAGFLTIKPQLGVLIPLAYLVAGAWRAFGVAAVTGILIHSAAILVFGPETISAFFNAVIRLQSDVAGSGTHTPPENMTTLFAQLRYWDVAASVAMPLHLLLAVSVVVSVTYLWWRHSESADQGLYLAALLGAGAILVTPYAYAYEMTALVPAALWLALKSGRYRAIGATVLAVAWALLAIRGFVPLDSIFQLPFLVSTAAFVFIAYDGFRVQQTSTATAES